MVVLVHTGFHGRSDDPANIKVCMHGTGNTRMIIEAVLSMLTTVYHFKEIAHQRTDYFRAGMAMSRRLLRQPLLQGSIASLFAWRDGAFDCLAQGARLLELGGGSLVFAHFAGQFGLK